VFVNERSTEDPGHKTALLNVLRQAGKVLEANNLLKRGGYDGMGAWVVWLGCMCGCATAAASAVVVVVVV
jgi:hypothetical protein